MWPYMDGLGLLGCDQLRWGHAEIAWVSNLACLVSWLQGGIGAHTHVTTGRMPQVDESRHWGDASTHQGMPRTASKPPEAMGETWGGSFSQPLKEPALLVPWSPISSPLNYEMICFCCFSHLVVVLWQPLLTNTPIFFSASKFPLLSRLFHPFIHL